MTAAISCVDRGGPSASNYVRGCRCDGCREANRERRAEQRASQPRARLRVRAETIARNTAIKAFRQMHPEMWVEIRTEAMEQAERELTE